MHWITEQAIPVLGSSASGAHALFEQTDPVPQSVSVMHWPVMAAEHMQVVGSQVWPEVQPAWQVVMSHAGGATHIELATSHISPDEQSNCVAQPT